MSGSSRGDVVALSLLIVASCFAHIGQGTLGLDGVRYAEIAKHILGSGSWSHLYDGYVGGPYFNKPPLLFWLTAASFKIFGYSTWAAKLLPAMFAAAAFVLLWRTGARAWGTAAGWAAVVLLLLSPITFRAVVDLNFEALMLHGGMLILGALLEIARGGEATSGRALRIGAGTALLLATKPPYVAFIVLPLLFTLFRLSPGRAAGLAVRVAAIALVGLFWLPVVSQKGYVSSSMENQLVEPFLLHRSFLSNLGRWIELMIAHLGPVTLVGGWALFRTIRRGRKEWSREDQLLMLWALPIAGIVPLTTVRLRYILVPALGLVLLGGRELVRARPSLTAELFRRGAVGVSLVVVALAFVPVVPLHEPDPFVAYLRDHPHELTQLPPLCVRDGAPGDIANPAQRRLELLVDFEFGAASKAYGSATIPEELWRDHAVVLAEPGCAAELERSPARVKAIERFPEGITRLSLESSACSGAGCASLAS